MPKNILNPGESLRPGEKLQSEDQRATLVMQITGNLALYFHDDNLQWKTNSSLLSVGAHVIMQPDGNLVIYTPRGTVQWSSDTWNNPGAYLKLQDDGNAVVYRPDGTALWASGTDRLVPVPTYVTGHGYRLDGGQGLGAANEYLRSPSGRYELNMQSDGNLVLYAHDHVAIWASFTDKKGGIKVIMQPDGNLVMYDRIGTPLWSTNTFGNPGAFLEMQDDGNLVLYRADRVALWSTNTMEFEVHDNGETVIFKKETEWDSDLVGGGFKTGVSIRFSKSGDVKFDGYVTKGGIQDYKYRLNVIVKSDNFVVAFQKSGQVAGSYLGSKTKRFEENMNSEDVKGFYADILRSGKIELLTNFKGSLTNALEDIVGYVFNIFVVGQLLSGIAPILFLGVELGSLIGTGSLASGSRVLAGILWMRGPNGTFYAIASDMMAQAGTTGRIISNDEYNWANNLVFGGTLPPQHILQITDTLGGGGAPFVFPSPGGYITINLGAGVCEKPMETNPATFIHELVHACQCHYWGHQSFVNKATITQIGHFCGSDAYNYDPNLPDNVAFTDYGVEQQASIVEDWAMMKKARDNDEHHPDVRNHRAYRFINENVRLGKY